MVCLTLELQTFASILTKLSTPYFFEQEYFNVFQNQVFYAGGISIAAIPVTAGIVRLCK